MINSLYIHIPFCTRKCIYCDFLSIPYNVDSAGKYIIAITNEFNLRKRNISGIKTVYIGGGTPTTLSPGELIRLFIALRNMFDIVSEAEITIEANPGTIDNERIEAFLKAGINRVSIGIQSFKDNELRMLGRIYSSYDAVNTVALLRQYGIRNISIDMIYALPGQTPKDWSYNISRAIEISPEHISAYELTPEQGTPLYEAITQGSIKKPDEDAIVGMYYHALDTLSDAGYSQYEISNFAREGFESRHNMNYWDRGEYLGLGAGAHSFINGMRIKNTSDIDRYISSLNTGRLAVEENTEVSCEDAIKEFIFLGIRKTEGLNIERFKNELGIDIVAAAGDLLANGLLVQDDKHLRLSRKGIVISNTVIIQMFEKLGLD